jgi:Bacterial Ig domain
VVPNPNGSLTYTPDADYSGPDSFAYEVCDDAPMVTLNGPGAANAGDTVTYTYTAVDLEPDLDGGLSNTASQAVNVAKAKKK